MSEAFFKAVRWVFAALCVVLGMYGFYAAEHAHNPKPLAFCLAGFGMAYMLSKVWKDTPGKISLTGAGLALSLAIISKLELFAVAVYVVTDYEVPDNFFISWSVLIVLICTPVMTVLLRYFD